MEAGGGEQRPRSRHQSLGPNGCPVVRRRPLSGGRCAHRDQRLGGDSPAVGRAC